jgi:hypothetical protein
MQSQQRPFDGKGKSHFEAKSPWLAKALRRQRHFEGKWQTPSEGKV